jgi:hypothetical protein
MRHCSGTGCGTAGDWRWGVCFDATLCTPGGMTPFPSLTRLTLSPCHIRRSTVRHVPAQD